MFVRSAASSWAVAPASAGTPAIAMGVKIPAGEQLAAGSGMAFTSTSSSFLLVQHVTSSH